MTDPQLASPSPRSWTVWLLVTGTVLAVVGLSGGLFAKRSADLASLLPSGSTRLVTPGASAPIRAQIALTFDPTSTHYAAPDYTLLWLSVALVIVGLIAVSAGTVVALSKRGTA
jgi:hypothetical protein